MRSRWIVLAALLLLAAACTADGGGADTATEALEVDAGESTEIAEVPSTESSPVAEEDAAETEEELAPAGTPDATMQALYDAFTLPEKGDPEAAVVLYEFSDYT